MSSKAVDIRIRKVKVLASRARELAEKQGLKEDDLVLVRTYVSSLPRYEIEEIKGSPSQYLQKEVLRK